jgi:hypothetical protein
MYKTRVCFPLLIILTMIWGINITGCSEDWAPVYFIEKLRILGIRAQPPDLSPGNVTQLEALVVDPENQNLNKNPQIEGMLCNSGLWPAGLRPIKLQPGKTYELAGIASSDSIERYSEMNPDGQLLEKEEKPIFSWFSR